MNSSSHRFDALLEPSADEVVLGAAILDMRERHQVAVLNAGSYAVGNTVFNAEEAQSAVNQEIAYVRYRLGELTPAQRAQYGAYASNIIKETTDNGEVIEDAFGWLSDARKGASNAEVESFIQRHVEIVGSQNENPRFVQEVAMIKSNYEHKLYQGVTEGWISVDAIESVAKIKSAGVYVGDMWDGAMDVTNGFHKRGTGYVVIRQSMEESVSAQSDDLSKRAQRTLPHEFSHVQFGDKDLSDWLDEALAEQLTVSMAYGKPETIDPSKRGSEYDRQVYTINRDILAVLMERGQQEIPTAYAMRAFTSAGSKSEEMLQWRNMLDTSWNQSNVIGWVDSILAHYESYLSGAHSDWTSQQVQTQALKLTRDYLIEQAPN